MLNQLEHDFTLPDRNAVEDAVDVATLFVEITNRIFRYFDTEFVVGELDHNPILDLEKWTYIHFVFDEKRYFYEVTGRLNGEVIFTENFTNNSSLCCPVLSMSILCDIYQSSADYEKAVLDFFDIVKNMTLKRPPVVNR